MNLEEEPDAELVRRAIAEYMRGVWTELPTNDSAVEVLENRRKYVVVRNGNKVLAVYRVFPQGLERQDAGRMS